jgi:hypothetical protein
VRVALSGCRARHFSKKLSKPIRPLGLVSFTRLYALQAFARDEETAVVWHKAYRSTLATW